MFPVSPCFKPFSKFEQVGTITSCTTGMREFNHFGMGYIKRRAASDGDTVTVGDKVVGTVVDVPFLFRHCPPPKSTNP